MGFFIMTLSGIVMQFAERIKAFMRYRQAIKIEKPLQSSRHFSLIVYQKNHSGIFKAQIMAENTENNKQLVNL